MRYTSILILLLLPFHAFADALITTFKTDSEGKLIGWYTPFAETGAIDTEMLYEGQTSFRLTRKPGFEDESIFVLQWIPLNFEAEQVELRARLKARETGPWAGVNIMLRQDIADNAIEFSNTQPFVTGQDTDWAEVRLTQRINPQADTLVFGAVLVGPGTAWVSDVELWADGERITRLPASEPESNAVSAEKQVGALLSRDIDWTAFDNELVENIATLIQAWGFLKYHTPQLAETDLNWDVPFIRSVQDLMLGKTLNEVLSELVEEGGELTQPEGVARTETGETVERVVSAWYQDNQSISPEISALFVRLQSERNRFGESKYAFADGMGMPSFASERKYRVEHLAKELQLLALARLWNVIEYWFPYREDLDTDWHAALRMAIPGVIEAEEPVELRYQLQALMTKMNDGHAGFPDFFNEPPFSVCRLPFGVRYLEDSVVVTQIDESFNEGSVHPGDVIKAINGVQMTQMMADWLPLVPSSNPVERNYKLAHSLMSRPCEEAATVVRVDRDGVQHDVALGSPQVVTTRFPHSLPGDAIQQLPEGVTYVNVTRLALDEVDEAVAQATETGRLILDVRGYPQDFILYHLGSRLVHEPVLFSHVAFVQPDSPGRVSIIDYKPTLAPHEPVELDSIAILVDESTFSQAEFSVLAWRELPNAVVVGSTTAGAVGDSRHVPLPDGTSVTFTGGRILDKNKQDVQFQGIVPDHYIRPSIQDIREGRSVVLNKAIELLVPRAVN